MARLLLLLLPLVLTAALLAVAPSCSAAASHRSLLLRSQEDAGGGDEESCGPSESVETPACKVASHKRGYELRVYPAGQMWAETVVSGESHRSAMRTGFYRCFHYISGENSRGEKIPMTAPVKVTPLHNTTTTTNNNNNNAIATSYSISFFVPSKYSSLDDVPEPTDPLVKIVLQKTKSVKAVLGPFGGFPGESDYEAKAQELADMLDNDGVKYDRESLVEAGYSSPFTLVNRHQEVWFDVVAHGAGGEDAQPLAADS